MESRIFAAWHSRRHFDFKNGSQKLDLRVYSAFDVIVRPGWRLMQAPQLWGEVWWVRAGEVEIEQSGAQSGALSTHRFTARGPCVVLLRGGESRATRQIGPELLSIAGFSFEARVWNALDGAALWDFPRHLAAVPPRLPGLMAELLAEAQSDAPHSASCVAGWAQLALFEVLRAAGIESAPQSVQKARFAAFEGALELVAARFHEPLGVAQLAGAVHLSTKHFGRQFRAALGLTPMEYVRRVRLGRARDLLAATPASVGRIARECGFESAAHFGRAFKREFGVAPLRFRTQARAATFESQKAPPKSISSPGAALK